MIDINSINIILIRNFAREITQGKHKLEIKTMNASTGVYLLIKIIFYPICKNVVPLSPVN